MWFMKENRPKLMEELDYKERQSAELNKVTQFSLNTFCDLKQNPSICIFFFWKYLKIL